jgi:hypothetical protein
MMDEVKMTLSIKSSSKLLSDAHAAPPTGARNGCPWLGALARAPKWPLGTIVVMMLAINTRAN